MGGGMVCRVGDVRVFPSMGKPYSQKICSRPPGFADLFDAPTPQTMPPPITVRLGLGAGGAQGWFGAAPGWLDVRSLRVRRATARNPKADFPKARGLRAGGPKVRNAETRYSVAVAAAATRAGRPFLIDGAPLCVGPRSTIFIAGDRAAGGGMVAAGAQTNRRSPEGESRVFGSSDFPSMENRGRPHRHRTPPAARPTTQNR